MMPRLRVPAELAAMTDPGPWASFLRSDNRSWREVAAEVFNVLRDPDARPEIVRQAAGELAILARAADEIAGEVRIERNQ